MTLRLRALGLLLEATSLAPVCAGQIASYSITPDLTSLPAGSNGASLCATVENLPQGSSFNVCFHTGFADMAPIVPDSLLYLGNSASISFHVAPSTIQNVPPASFRAVLSAPGIVSVNFSGNGNRLTVTVRGFSNTREIIGAKFHFKPVGGASIKTQDVTIDAQALYASWYASDASLQYALTPMYSISDPTQMLSNRCQSSWPILRAPHRK